MILKRQNTFPDSDGRPMADNTLQAFWIFVLFGNLLALFRNRPDVFVAADNLWYPVEETELVRIAPDVYVVFGRPKGHRGSYRQWEEDDIPLTVVFDVFSPGNTWREMMDKRDFCEEHGVEEYYILDPQENDLVAYTRGPNGAALVRRYLKDGFVSPRLGIRFAKEDGELKVYYPNGERFLTFELLKEAQEKERERAADAETRLARVIVLGRKARHGTASPEELAELERLEAE